MPAQKDGGATILEIGQQPDVWREVAGRADEAAAGFLREVVGRPDIRIVLTGAGSSAFLGEIAAPALRRHLGRRVEAVPTTDIVASPARPPRASHPDPDGLLRPVGQQPGKPRHHCAGRRTRRRRLASHPHLRPRRSNWAARTAVAPNSCVVYMPERTNDSGFAMTSSLTSMLLTCLLLLGPATADDGEALARAAEHVAGLQPDIRTLAQAKKQRFVYLGSGPLEGLAHESALKMLELTAGEVVTYFDSPLGFRHGPKSALDGDTLVVVYVSTDPYTRRYDLDIIAEIRAQLGQDAVVVISTEPIPDTHGPAVVLPGLDGLDDARGRPAVPGVRPVPRAVHRAGTR